MEEEKKEQTMRFTDEELDLIKNTFKDNLPLLKAIRKIFLQIEISESEDIIIKDKIKNEVLDVVRKMFLPTLDGDAPINQPIDLWLTVDIKDLPTKEAYNILKARKIVIAYIDQQLNSFDKKVEQEINFKLLSTLATDPEIAIMNLTARNTIVLQVENRIQELNTLANQTELTEEEQKKKDEKDSNQ